MTAMALTELRLATAIFVILTARPDAEGALSKHDYVLSIRTATAFAYRSTQTRSSATGGYLRLLAAYTPTRTSSCFEDLATNRTWLTRTQPLSEYTTGDNPGVFLRGDRESRLALTTY